MPQLKFIGAGKWRDGQTTFSLLFRPDPKFTQRIFPDSSDAYPECETGVLLLPERLTTNHWKTPNFYAIIFVLKAAILERNAEWVELSAEPVIQFIISDGLRCFTRPERTLNFY